MSQPDPSQILAALVRRGLLSSADVARAASLPEEADPLSSLLEEGVLDPLSYLGLLEDMQLERGEAFTLGGYRILEELGRGAMGVVYHAVRESDGQEVALKIMLSLNATKARERFRRESESVSRLSHPNIVPLVEAGEEQGLPFMAMGYVEGTTLQEAYDDLSVEELVRLAIPIARALDHAHGHGIVHRDLKPANVLLDTDGTPYIADFGLARQMDRNTRLTQTGSAIGTPYYMAPEVATGQAKEADGRADVYALGVILYQGLTGRLPYEASSLVKLYQMITESDPTPISELQPDLPQDLQTIVERAMARPLWQRYPTAAALAEDLEKVDQGIPLDRGPGWNRPLLAGGVVLLAGLSLLGALVLLPTGPLQVRIDVTSPRADGTVYSGEEAVPMLRIAADAVEEKAWLEMVEVRAEGTGDDMTALTAVRLVADENGDGLAQETEPVLDARTFPSDDGTLRFANLEHPLRGDASRPLLFLYDFAHPIPPGRTFSLQIVDLRIAPFDPNRTLDVKQTGEKGRTVTVEGPVTYRHQPGPEEGKDTFIRSYGLYPNDNYGRHGLLSVGDRDTQPGEARAFIQFDLSFLPTDVRIRKAELKLYLEQFSFHNRSLTLQVFVVAETRNKNGLGAAQTPWVEGESNIDFDLDGMAWNGVFPHNNAQRPQFTRPDVHTRIDWGHGPNGIVDEESIDDRLERWITLDVTPAVQAWIEGRLPNHGLMLRHAEEGPPFDNGTKRFASSDHKEPDKRPQLIVTVE